MIALLALCAAAPLAMLRAGEAPQAKSPPPTTQPLADVEGDILDSDGKPVAGAIVQMVSARLEKRVNELAGYDVVSQTRSNQAGIFHLPMPPLEQRKAYPIRATAPGYAYGYAILNQSNGGLSFFDGVRHYETGRPSIVLAPESRLGGIVVDRQGKPIAGAKIMYTAIDNPAVTDATGRFAFAKVPPSRVGVVAEVTLFLIRHPRLWCSVK